MARIYRNRLVAIALILCSVGAQRAIAFLLPLQPEAVREAYFFGHSTDRKKVSDFLEQYIRHLPTRSEKPGVGAIELLTPYAQVVHRSFDISMGYSAPQAQIDYDTKPGLIQVRVWLYVGSIDAYKANLFVDNEGHVRDRRENFWQEFQFSVTQEHIIEPTKIEGKPVYSRRGLGGAEIWLIFDAAEFASGTAKVEVTAPDHQTVVADFDLDKLK